MLPGGGRSGDMPTEQELAERLQQTNISGPWQAGVAYPGQLATAYAVPYGVAAPFPQQAQPGFALTPQGQVAAATAQYSQAGTAQSGRRPASGSRPASAPGQRPALQSPSAGIRPSGPQYAAFYPQFQAAYPMQYMPPAAAFRPLPAQQLQPFPAQFIQPAGVRAQFQFPGAQFPGAAAFQQPGRQGRAGGRQPQRGRFPRGQQDPNRGRGQGQYRALWQQVTQVGQGQNWQQGPEQLTVEDLVAIVQRLPPGMPAVPAVAMGLHSLDSRACAALLKELSSNGLPHHALAIFDWLQSLPMENQLSRLCDVFTYTTVISLCGQRQELHKALKLVADMRGRGVMPNIHTYTALINTCTRSGDYTLALDVFRTLEEEGCQPNVVTYNTLIDVYGKMGRWQDAVQVLDDMTEKGWQPETRTFNTAIIACNMCNQSAQALQVYERMQQQGLEPTATTYTALVSAHCKSDNLVAALEVYNSMIVNRQERNIITYSSLIAAADRAGQWEEGLNIWGHLLADRCHPNLPAYNSAISCCAQGGKWQQAKNIFEQMKAARFKPDMATYTGLLAAYHPANKWRHALQALEQMQAASIRPDTATYAAVIDLLWCSGILGAQQRAQQLFQMACRQSVQGMEASQAAAQADEDTVKVSITAPTPSIAVLALHKWLQDCRHALQDGGPAYLRQHVALMISSWTPTPLPDPTPAPTGQPPTQASSEAEEQISSSGAASQAPSSGSSGAQTGLARAAPGSPALGAGPSSPSSRAGRGRSPSRGQKRPASNLPAVAVKMFGPDFDAAANKAAILDMIRGFGLPFSANDEQDSFSLSATAEEVVAWLQAPQFETIMASFAQPITSPLSGRAVARSPMQANLAFLQAEEATASNCSRAWESMRKFESFFPNMTLGAHLDQQYLSSRPQCLALAKQLAGSLGLNEALALDAVLMLDRLVHQSENVFSQERLEELTGASLVMATRYGLEQPQPTVDISALATLINVPSGVLDSATGQLETVCQSLTPEGESLTTVSAVRCLNVYLERLQALQITTSDVQDTIHAAFESGDFVSVQPSLLAAVAFRAHKERQGVLPVWPTALAELTGWNDSQTQSDFHKALLMMREFVDRV